MRSVAIGEVAIRVVQAGLAGKDSLSPKFVTGGGDNRTKNQANIDRRPAWKKTFTFFGHHQQAKASFDYMHMPSCPSKYINHTSGFAPAFAPHLDSWARRLSFVILGSGDPHRTSLTQVGYKHGDSDLAIYKILRGGIPGTSMPSAGLALDDPAGR